MVDLSVRIGDVELANPVMPASGTFSYEFADVIDLNRLGALVAKTLSRLDLSLEHEERLATMTKALVKKLLHQPTKILRDRKDEAFTQNARELFGLDEE